MKYKKGQKVTYRGQQWTVSSGGCSNPTRKVYMYSISRGSWRKKLVAGDCITA